MRDTSVWAFSEFFFLISLFFFVLNGSFILCIGYKLRNTCVKSGDDKNRPKRRETRPFGPLVSVFFFFHVL